MMQLEKIIITSLLLQMECRMGALIHSLPLLNTVCVQDVFNVQRQPAANHAHDRHFH